MSHPALHTQPWAGYLSQHRCSPHVTFNLIFHNILSLPLPLPLFLSLSASTSLSFSLPPFLLSLSGFHKSSLSKLYASFMACLLHPVSSENHLWSLCQNHSCLRSWSLCPWLEVRTFTASFFQSAVNYSYLYKHVSLLFFRFSKIHKFRSHKFKWFIWQVEGILGSGLVLQEVAAVNKKRYIKPVTRRWLVLHLKRKFWKMV